MSRTSAAALETLHLVLKCLELAAARDRRAGYSDRGLVCPDPESPPTPLRVCHSNTKPSSSDQRRARVRCLPHAAHSRGT